MLLKEMRLADGKNQDGYIDDGLTRRQYKQANLGEI
jgi:hypothetical protein